MMPCFAIDRPADTRRATVRIGAGALRFLRGSPVKMADFRYGLERGARRLFFPLHLPPNFYTCRSNVALGLPRLYIRRRRY